MRCVLGLVTLLLTLVAFGPSTALAAGVWSAPTAIESGGSLYSVSCSSATFCVAEAGGDYNGNGTNALTYNGTSWSATALAVGFFSSVSCPSVTFCLGVGGDTYDGPDALTYNGTSWSAPTQIIDGNGGLSSVSCSSATFCAAIAFGGTLGKGTAGALTYNGTSWTTPTQIDDDVASAGRQNIDSLSCPSATFCVAVDVNGNALTYNGTSWSAPTLIDGGNGGVGGTFSVSCSSATFCVAVDRKGNALTYNGTSWTTPTKVGGVGGFDAVSCPSATFCGAAGFGGQGEIALTYTTSPREGQASASVKIEKFKVTTSSLVVTIKTSRAGTVTITGPGLKKTTRTVAAGTRVMTVVLTKAGKAERAGRKKIKLSVSLKTSIKTVSRSVEIKL